MTELFSPFSLRGTTYSNRIAVSPMAQYKGENGAATRWHDQHLGSFAVSGPGLVIMESTSVEREGWGSNVCLALHSDRHEAAIRQVLENIRSYSDTPFGIQFGHSGRKGSGKTPSDGRGPLLPQDGGWPVWAPSAIPFSPSYPVPEALDCAGLTRVREAYRQAGERAARLGLSLVELHGAHGYLLHTFLSPLSNQRTDDYGGSTAKRAAFVAEIVALVRAELSDDMMLGIRLNAHDFADGGMTFDDTLETARILKEAGLDYVCVSAGAITSEAKIQSAPGYLVPYASDIKKKTGLAAFVTGMILEAHQAEEVIAGGHADMLEIARGFLDDPRWVWHAAEALGEPLDIPMQYWMAKPERWPGAQILRGSKEAAE
ncbi:oxidoreductase [Oricola sp.]|uniref:oxidoreductase n=1 Tax=Oricola sp. TaxID=1979950 RepID=UPI003BAB3955